MTDKFRAACEDHQVGENPFKCLSQGHSRMALAGFESDYVDYNHGVLKHLTTLPT